MTIYLLGFLTYLAVMSVIAFFMYGADKRKAKLNAWRTKESALLGIGFFGGAIGAILGMKVFRHKTKHWYFWGINYAGLLIQLAIAATLFKMGVK